MGVERGGGLSGGGPAGVDRVRAPVGAERGGEERGGEGRIGAGPAVRVGPDARGGRRRSVKAQERWAIKSAAALGGTFRPKRCPTHLALRLPGPPTR